MIRYHKGLFFAHIKPQVGWQRLSSTWWFTDPVSFHPMASSPLYVSVGRQFSLDFLGSYMVWTFPRKGCWWVSFKADWIANWRYRTFLFLETFQEEKVPFFPGGQVVKILCFHCRGQGLNPWIGNEDPISCSVWTTKKKAWKYAFLPGGYLLTF